MFDNEKTRNYRRIDFPFFEDEKTVFLDSAASAQKPLCVIEKMKDVYLHQYANVHRGAYSLSEQITIEYENARKTVQNFINAKSSKEIIFTKGATEGINLVASSYARKNLSKNDEIIISEAEHHANLVPWQMLAQEFGFKLVISKINDDGSFDFKDFQSKLNNKTKVVAITGMSNVLGNFFPIKEICEKSKEFGAKILIDASQLVVHGKIDVQNIGCDFLVFSSHKIYGPTGAGVLFAKEEVQNDMIPYQFGGDMVEKVSFEKTTFAKAPAKFEAGTPPFVEAIGLSEAIKYVQKIGYEEIKTHEANLSKYMIEKLSKIEDLEFVGDKKYKHGVFSFIIKDIHASDIAFYLNKQNICVRIGHHCAEPLINRMGYKSVIRASLGIYSNYEDIDKLSIALQKAIKFFKE